MTEHKKKRDDKGIVLRFLLQKILIKEAII